MSFLGIASAVTIGSQVIDAITINYTKSFYEEKIKEFDSCITQLNAHLETLEGYKNEIKSFWDDEEAVKFSTILTSEIISIRNQIESVNNLKAIYNEVVAEFDRTQGVVGDVIDAAKSAIESLGISD